MLRLLSCPTSPHYELTQFVFYLSNLLRNNLSLVYVVEYA